MMYTLRPIVSSTDACPRAKSMYEMRNIQGDDRTTEPTTTATTTTTTTTTPCGGTKMPDVTEQNTSPDYNTLATRQEEILKQLAELKAQIFTLCKFLKRSSQETVRRKIESEMCQRAAVGYLAPQEPVTMSLVLNVNPWKPPYSIYALQKLWKDTNFIVHSYTHSTIVGRVPIDFQSSTHSGSNNVINLTIIYKAINDLEIVTSLFTYPLIGEVNLLRYLSRLLRAHDYEKKDLKSTCITDSILDLCYRVRYQTSRDNMDETLSMLYQELDKSLWSGRDGPRDEPSIADIAAWSTIKQYSSNRKLPPNIQKWYDLCDEIFMGNASARLRK